MDCLAFDQGRCRSCTLLDVPQPQQVASKVTRLEGLLARVIGADAVARIRWQQPLVSPPSGFRSKAKMVVGGTVHEPTLGILGPDGEGVDLSDCALHDDRIIAVLPAIRAFITRAGLTPYHVPTRSGELKNVLITVAPSGALMARFVLRSTEALARMRKHLPSLLADAERIVVVTANILPEHKAVMEGDREIVLTEAESLPMTMGAVTLNLRPQSFFQTNTVIATELYAQVAAWVNEVEPRSVWDLYCGVGGFALHCLAPGRKVTGVEVSEQAVASAIASADALALAGRPGAREARFVAADATAWAREHVPPDVVIVNPPRRGIGRDLAQRLEASGVDTVVYSSCNAVTLATDLEAMPSFEVAAGRLLDMFPHTDHFECVVLLKRHEPTIA